MTTIHHSIAYGLSLNSEKFTKGAKLSKSEARLLNRELKAIETPAEKYEKRLNALNKAHSLGRVSTEKHRLATDKLNKEFREGRQTTSQWHSAVSQVGSRFLQINPYVVAFTAAVGGMTAGIKLAKKAITEVLGEFGDIDEVAKAAAKIDIATESLIAFRMQASEMSGVSADQVDRALQRMQQSIGDAIVKPGTEAGRIIEELGLNARELAADPERALREFSDAIRNAETQAEKTAIATAIFGRAGKDLVETLDAGSAAINRYRQEAEELGLTFNALDAAAIEEANDNFARMESALKGVKTQAALAIGDEIAAGLTIAVQLIKDARQGVDGLSDSFRSLSEQSAPFRSLMSALGGVNEVFNPHFRAVGDIADQQRRRRELDKQLADRPEQSSDTFFDPVARGFNTQEEARGGVNLSRIEEARRAARERVRQSERVTKSQDKFAAALDKAWEKAFAREPGAFGPSGIPFRPDEPETFERALGPAAIRAGSQDARAAELRARGFGVGKKETQSVEIAPNQFQQLIEQLATVIDVETDESGTGAGAFGGSGTSIPFR